MYTFIKVLHVFLAIIAVGFNASYGIWLGRAAKEPDHELHVLRTIKVLDDRFANPAYALLLISGVAMVLIADIPLTTFWIAASLALYVFVVIVGLGLYTPTLRRQIQALENEGAESANYKRLATRGNVLGIVLGIPIVVIVFLMVLKPTL
jgi:uncharacterized membrane protein